MKVMSPDRLESAAGVWEVVAEVEAQLGHSGRVVIRPSGTESAVRVMVEADDAAMVDQALTAIVEAVERDLGRVSL